MRGEHCVAGATILSVISVILLIFAHIGQVSSGALVRSIYMAEVNVAAYGNGFQGGTNTSASGLYDTNNTDHMGAFKGLRQYYRYGMYNACGYQKDGSGVCNSSTFAYPMEPLAGMIGDVPSKFRIQTVNIIPSSTFKDNSYNHGMSKAGSGLIFVGSCAAALALIFGVIKLRLTFFIASICAGVGAFLLMLGAALWTAVIAKDAWLGNVKVQHGYKLGIYVTAGPSIYLVWVAFALTSLSCLPYVIACCTYRK
ncbi:hypothetical protein CNN01480 [Cryptococcus deneoformans JEC21]|uniref:Claudin family protein n=1 Tax=Cryptococcus deneoformans (strain JEC21 / ATCC MYA-565) TaxID=214684 RepID=Q5K714_CRYD1|nr:hypothetical protein CNN01480 [Cryptococcus neoformans var. neoformans JEC21]AAW47100.2 hypothetical protein CNN01480 [Cryptococcus neoformans var. neoformans JEC21]